MPLDEKIRRVTFFILDNEFVMKNTTCYQKGGFLEYYAPYRNMSHYQPLRYSEISPGFVGLQTEYLLRITDFIMQSNTHQVLTVNI
jgi:hypothetical protein